MRKSENGRKRGKEGENKGFEGRDGGKGRNEKIGPK